MMENSRPSNSLFEEIHELTAATLTGAESVEERARLEELILSNEQARTIYVRYIQDTVLLVEAAEDGMAQPTPPPEGGSAAKSRVPSRESRVECPVSGVSSHLHPLNTQHSTHNSQYTNGRDLPDGQILPSRIPGRRGRLIASAGLAAMIALSAVLFRWLPSADDLPSRPVAKLQQSTDALWSKDGQPVSLKEGDSLLNGRYVLVTGIAQITFPWGTRATLEAPVDIELRSDDTRRLSYGKLVATVPQDDTGFVIEMPAANVIDLGTEFGVDVRPNGDSEVHVFKGEVETRQSHAREALRLVAGEARSFRVNDPSATSISFNPKRFSRAWQSANGIVKTEGAMRFLHPQPHSVVEGQTESNDHILVFLERENVTLKSVTAVTLRHPGLSTTFHHAAWIPPGTTVDSYLLHFDPVGSSKTQPPVTCHGSVTFDRPIVGVIARGDQLSASDAELAHPGTQVLKDGFGQWPYTYTRGLMGLWNLGPSHQVGSPAANDRLRLSSDRKTLTLTCSAGGEADQVRVLVAAADTDPSNLAAPEPGPSAPFLGRPFQVGEKIEAEDFDLGGDGVAYFDDTPNLISVDYRPGEGVEIPTLVQDDQTIVYIGHARPGEWLAYTVEVQQAGEYFVSARVDSRYGGGQFHVEFGDDTVGATMTIPNTGPAVKFETIRSEPIKLKPGRQIMRVVMDKEHELDWIGQFDFFRIDPAPSGR